jgi:hypothetical protein
VDAAKYGPKDGPVVEEAKTPNEIKPIGRINDPASEKRLNARCT